MTNTNCLEGMRCPQCKALDPFKIDVVTTLTVYDDGGGDSEGAEWEHDSPCECIECNYRGTVQDFYIAVQEGTEDRRPSMSTDGTIENAIAISACLHGSNLYHQFYASVGDRLGGFTGIYDLCQSMARVVTAYENKHGGQFLCWENPSNKFDWAEMTEQYADAVLNTGINEFYSLDAQKIFDKLFNQEGDA